VTDCGAILVRYESASEVLAASYVLESLSETQDTIYIYTQALELSEQWEHFMNVEK